MSSGGTQRLLLMSSNSDWNIWNFRMELIAALQRYGYRIAVAAPPGEHEEAVARAGVDFYPMPMRASGTSPIEDAALIARYWLLMRRLKPFAYLGFTPKPNIHGSIAARLRGVPRIVNVTGLGTAFIHGGGLERLVSSLYRQAFRGAAAALFHNRDDRDLFVARKLVSPAAARVIPGSGVDLDRFAPSPLPDTRDGLRFLFVGRLLREKGVEEFGEAAGIVRRRHPQARFQLLGALDESRRGIPRALVDQWVKQGTVEYLGSCGDVRPCIEQAHCVVLPSWREGLPRVILEAAAMARPAIVSDAPGCRDAVIDEATGYLFKVRSSEALAAAIERMIGLSGGQREAMGQRARRLAEEKFGIERVWNEYVSILERIGEGQ